MTRGVYSPDVDFEDYVLPRENGGTGVESLAKAASSIGVVSNSNKDVNGGVAGLDSNAKVLASVLPITPDTNFVNVSGNFRLIENFAYTFVITDFDSFKNYEVTCSNGTMTRNGDTLFYTANNNLGAHTFTVNGRVFDFIIQIPGPDTPTITSPVANANVLTPTYTLTGSAFVQFGDASTHLSSDWQISTSPTFDTLAFSTTNDTTNRVSWQVTGLVDTTVYYARLRYRATNNNYSDWSSAITFTVAIPVPVTPVISSPLANAIGVTTGPTIVSSAFTPLGDSSTHVSSDWEIATDANFNTIVKTSLADAVNRTSWTTSGLNIVTQHYVRVRHRSSNGKVSAYSDAITFTTTNAFVYSHTVTADTLNYNMRTVAVAAGWNQADPLHMTTTVNSGVTIGSATTGSYSFDTGAALPAGSLLTLINGGNIVGRGGNGNGAPGGPALRAQAPMSITNNNVIGGGGGAGGHGGAISDSFTYATEDGTATFSWGCAGGGGGGGAGFGLSAGGGTVGGQYGITVYTHVAGGSAGTRTTGGAGGAGTYGNWGGPNHYVIAGTGGAGGALGANGSGGGTGYDAGENFGTRARTNNPLPMAGGLAGQAIVGNSNITFVTLGTILGARV